MVWESIKQVVLRSMIHQQGKDISRRLLLGCTVYEMKRVKLFILEKLIT